MRSRRRGGALVMVLWLSAALSAIAFSVALTVRNEIARTDTALEGLRAYYLACGAADRALNYMTYGGDRYWMPGMPLMVMRFPNGEAVVEIRPESSKLNVNKVEPGVLNRLLIVLGVPPEEARVIAMSVDDWRSEGSGLMDRVYLTRTPTFRAPHASFEQIEELMSVNGVTPDLYYGGYQRDLSGALMPRAGLRDCLSVYSSGKEFDVNTVSPAVLLAMGAPPMGVEQLVALRRRMPILPAQMGAVSELLGPAGGLVRLGGDHIYTLRATARLRRPDGRLSDLRRSVAMTVQIGIKDSNESFRVLAWQDYAAETPLFQVWPN